MVYLLAKMFILLVVAVILGFLLGRWSVLRRYKDVTEEYGRWLSAPVGVSAEAAASAVQVDLTPISDRLTALEASVRALPESSSSVTLSGLESKWSGVFTEVKALVSSSSVDLGPVEARLQALEEAVDLASVEGRLGELSAAVAALESAPEDAVDLGPLEAKLDALADAVAGMPRASGEAGDFARVETRLDEVGSALDALRTAEPEPVDLSRVESRLEDLLSAVEAMEQHQREAVDLSNVEARLDALTVALETLRQQESEPTDLSAVEAQLDAISKAVRGLPKPEPVKSELKVVQDKLSNLKIPEPKCVDLAPIDARLAELEAAVRSIRMPAPNEVDLQPLARQLSRFEHWLRAIEQKPVPAPGPPMFKSATLGPKDDLKRISGVGEVLEKLLNDLGVYYFFQVASWSPEDVQYVDDRLEAFKGRIQRDDWVEQAKDLARSSRVKPPPGLIDTAFGLEPGAEITSLPTSEPQEQRD